MPDQIKLMLNRKENSEIEDLKLRPVISHHKRRLAVIITEFILENNSNQLKP